MTRTAAVVFGLLVVVTFVPARAADPVAGKIEAIINGPDYKHGRWGILVVDAKTGKTVYEHNADKLCLPASTTKLYSCAAALVTLGADHRFETPVYRRGTFTDGRLQGDLILVAQGDLTMGGRTKDGVMAYTDSDHIYATPTGTKTALTDTDPLAGLKDLARQVKAAGVKRIEGDVLIDDRLFAKARGSGSGPDLLTPVLINDNLVDVIVTPAKEAGKPATVRLRPETSYVQADAQVTTEPAGKRPRVEVVSAGGRRFIVRGQVPLGSKRVIRTYEVADPAGYARALFIEALRAEGVFVKASPLQSADGELPEKESYARLPRVAVHKSLPLSEAVKVTLKVSHNLYASTLPLLLAAKKGKRTLHDGMRVQRQALADLGVDLKSISFAGGAGGANADSVTPRATVQLLQGMAKRPEWKVYEAGLPVLGVDGTLSDAVAADSPAKGKVRAKTGTLMWLDRMNDRLVLRSKALAGILTTAKGRKLYVAMFVNDVPLPPGVTTARENRVLGKLCEILYRDTP